jgi:hypothetical protein
MWDTSADRAGDLARAVDFTGDAELYGAFMLEVVRLWPVSCEHNLTEPAQNRRAWLGHAACCMAIGCPEDVTREAWWHLTDQQRTDADQRATEAIQRWECEHGFARPACPMPGS